MRLTLIRWIIALTLTGALSACGGEPEATSTPTPPTPPTPPTTATGAGAGGAEDLSGPEFQGDHSLTGDPVAGEVVYRANCIACHTENGRGNGGMTGADLVGDTRRLSKNNETLIRSITDGIANSPPMPAHRDILTETQIRDVLSFVRSRYGASGS